MTLLPPLPTSFSEPHFLSWSWVLPREASLQFVSGKRKGSPSPCFGPAERQRLPGLLSLLHAHFPAPLVRAPSFSWIRRKQRPDRSPGPCFGRSALCVFILPSIFLPSPCPRPKLSTRECSGQLPGLDGALREFSIPVPGPVVSSLVAPAGSSGRPPLAAPNPVLGAAV